MKRRLIGTVTSLVITLVLLCVWRMNISDITAAVLLYAISLSAVCTVCFGVTVIFAWKKSDISPYWIFGATDVLLGGVAMVIAVLDFKSARSGLDGLVGGMILVVGVPVMLVVLLGNYIASKLMNRQ